MRRFLIINQKEEQVVKTTTNKDSIGKAGLMGGRLGGLGVKKGKEKEEGVKEEEKQLEVSGGNDHKKNEDSGDFKYLYTAFDLFTNVRRRNQIIIIQSIIYRIKQEFNTEFESLMAQRVNSVDFINEKNKRIQEILTDLQKPINIFDPKKNFLENPENILTVKPEEIPFEKYYSKDERERRENEKLKEEERRKALLSDDSSLRA